MTNMYHPLFFITFYDLGLDKMLADIRNAKNTVFLCKKSGFFNYTNDFGHFSILLREQNTIL
ncbi:hypothetical protein COM96_18840 [Bacillus cereus]|uniref:Uncharacterized protein n=1 Tax=Bacillus cereus TaxID=1396 RepID=A0A2A7HUE2_BACCE|nr:hypothetical protein COM96_18840 [Bacillus cereus]